MITRVRTLAGAAAVCLAATLLAAPAAPAQTAPNGDLAFHGYNAGQYDIYVRSHDGGTLTNLTSGEGAYDTSPDWSPDGTKILFTSNRTGWNEIYVMDADGSDVTQLTSAANEYDESWGARWSPDGTKILYTFDPTMGSGGDRDLFTMSPDGTNKRSITDRWESGLEYDDYAAQWSSDGARIVFGAMRPGDQGATWEIVTANADGSGQQRLLGNMDHQRWVEYPSFSPDGQRIVFMQASPSGGDWDVWVMNADGSAQENVTQHPAGDDFPTWSNDGRQIYFSSNRDGGSFSDLYVLDLPVQQEQQVAAAPSGTRLRARAAAVAEAAAPTATRVLGNVSAPDFAAPPPPPADRNVTLTDYGPRPLLLRTRPGLLVRWTNKGTRDHSLLATPVRLFFSGPVVAGGTIEHRFIAAGTYTLKDRTTSQTQTVEVALGATRVGTGRTIRLTWGSEQLTDERLYEVQVRGPRRTGFSVWRKTVAPSGDFLAPAAGGYEFRARLRRDPHSPSYWSPVRVVDVP